MSCLESFFFYFKRWLRHSFWRWRRNNSLYSAPKTRILSWYRTIRPESVTPWELRRQTSVLLRAIFCSIQNLHRYGTLHSLVTDLPWLQFICLKSSSLSRFFFAKSPLIPCVNLRLAAAMFETTFQPFIPASLHLHNIDHFSITHKLLVNLTHAG